MKRLKGLLILGLVFISTVLLSNTKSFAAEVQYTGNIIPTMTNNTSPSGIASASSVFASDFPAWKAFDKNISTNLNGWVTANGSVAGWLEYDFIDAKSITKYKIICRPDAGSNVSQLPKDWTFEAYDELLAKWVVLDTQANITDWNYLVKKEFTFSNSNLYKKYRINITNNCGGYAYTAIGELEMMETIPSPTTLSATAINSNANLSWTPAVNAQYYNIKRSPNPEGPFDTTIATSSAINFTDKNLQPGTYYYVVSTVISGKESANSNVVSVTIPDVTTPPDHTGNTATLILTMTNGGIKSYDLTINDLDSFLTWYDKKSDGTGKSYYIINKTTNIAPYLSIKEYVSFDKISSFEVKEYNQ
jgi:hypothetical protein